MGGYMKDLKCNSGYLVTPIIFTRVDFGIHNSIDEMTEGTSCSPNKPTLRIVKHNHHEDDSPGLFSAWYSMIQDTPPRTLEDSELENLKAALQELKK
ncbi:hypothetical protein CANMA_005416 [Candida margitis]|uniref:uncharacterized protein n=1 Tax=Candida margitis TaxID=1775924 RepID=UPI002225C7E4|nr:uncharacterized protein CANMA_005416 [Candida margitis]KAI5949836.1 hypothetical protein CANMA_005416 [Candida margitis]